MGKKLLIVLLCLVMVFLETTPMAMAAGIPIYKDGVFYQDGKVIAIDDPPASKEKTFVIQESVNGKTVTEIEDGALWGLPTNPFSILIPDSVTKINDPGWGDELDHVTVIANDGSGGARYAAENDMKRITPEQNQKRLDAQTFNNKTITVYYNDKHSFRAEAEENEYVLADKKVSVVLEEYDAATGGTKNKNITLTDGSATVKGSNAAVLKITREDYRSITVNFKDLAEEDNNYYLEPLSEEVIVNGVYVTFTDENGKEARYDIYHHKYVVDQYDSRTATYSFDIDWGEQTPGSVKLSQTGKELAFDMSTKRLSCVFGEHFDVGEDICLVVTTASGKVFKNNLSVSGYDNLDGLKLDFTSGVKFTLPDKIPFVGGRDMGLDLGGFPLAVSVDDGKVSVSVGLVGGSIEYEDKHVGNKKPGKKPQIEGLIGDLKEDLADAKKDAKRIKKLFTEKKYRDYLKRKPAAFGATGEAAVMGYIEAVIRPDGSMRISDSMIIVQLEGKLEWNGPIPNPWVPAYWEVYIKGDLNGEVSVAKVVQIALNDSGKNPFKPIGSLSFEPALGGGVGLGVADLLSAGGGLEGGTKIAFTWKTQNWHYKWTGRLSVYAKAKALFWEWNKTWTVAQGTWKENTIPYDKAKSSAAAAVALQEVYDPQQGAELAALYDPGAYRLDDQSYLNEPGDFNSVQLMGDDAYEVFLTNVYEAPEAQLVQLDNGTQLMVWLGGVAERESPNKTAIYWSMCPAGGDWTTPQIVDQDDYADFAPVLTASGNTAWLVWQNANQVFDAGTVTAEDAAAGMDLWGACFNGETFEDVQALCTNGIYDYSPAAAAEGDACVVYWLQSASNVMTGVADDAVVMSAAYENGRWSDAEAVFDGADAGLIIGLAAGMTEDGTSRYALTVDTDGDALTTTDMELWVDGEQATDNELLDSAPIFVNGTLYWFRNGTVIGEDDTVLLPDGVTLDTDRFTILADETGRLVVLYCVESGALSELYGVFYDPDRGTASQPVALTEFGEHVTSESGIYTADGLTLAAAVTAVTGEISGDEEGTENGVLPFGQTDLTLVRYTETSELSIDHVSFNKALLVPNTNYTVSVTVMNTGAKPADAFDVVLWDTPGNMPESIWGDTNSKVADIRVLEPLAGGDTTTVELTFCLPETYEGDYDLTLTPCTDVDVYDETAIRANAVETQVVTFNSGDLIMDAESAWGEGRVPVVTGTISNAGKAGYENLPVSLYAVYEDGEEELLDSKNVSVEAKSYAVVTFPLEKLAVDQYRLVIEEQDDEINHANNSDFCVFLQEGSLLAEQVKFTDEGVTATVQILLSESEEDAAEYLFAASYDGNGKMGAIMRYAVTGNGAYDISLADSQAQALKLFLMDDQFQPIEQTAY